MVDTNVVIDLIEKNGPWLEWSLNQLLDAQDMGVVAVSAIVAGELSPRVASYDELCSGMAGFGLTMYDFGASAAYRAGQAQKAYRAAGGTRERLLGDFLIGAHAETKGATLLTRDARRYRHYFPELTLITPEIEQ